MSTIIKRLKDKLGNFVLPITNTKAVYDDNGNRLDNLLDGKYSKEGDNKSIQLSKDSDNKVPSFRCITPDWDNNKPIIDYVIYDRALQSETDCLRLSYTGEKFEMMGRKGNGDYKNITITSQNTISDAYDPSKTYLAGQYCIYNNTLWKSRVDNNLGNTPTEGTYWTATSVGKNLITTNGEGKFGYLGADDSFVPFKSGEGYTLYDDITRIAAVQGAKDLTVLENYPVKKGDLLFVCIILQSGTYYTLDHSGPQWKFFENYLSNYGGQNTYVIQILEDGNLTMISRASSTAHYVYVRRFINNS